MSRLLADYPPWFVAAAVTLAATLALWMLAKVLKWILWLLLIAILAGGTVLTVWMVFKGSG
jgi:hypothetical protein